MSTFLASSWPCRDDQRQFPDISLGDSLEETVEEMRITANPCLPLTLECLGGIWEGRLFFQSTTVIKVQVDGFPPIASHQRISICHSGSHSEESSFVFEGIIREVQTHRKPQFWESTTEFFVDHSSPIVEMKDGPVKAHLPWFCSRSHCLRGRIFEQRDDRVLQISSRLGPTRCLEKREVSNAKRSSQKEHLVQSMPIIITKENGQHIHAFYDGPKYPESELPVVVIAPGYGETTRDYLVLAYYLATNGFQVVRYDHTNHVGASDGDHVHFTLSSMKEDFQAITHFARVQWPKSRIIGLASSLAARVAVKAEAEQTSVDHLILLVGIVNIRSTIAAVHLEDVFAERPTGVYPKAANILGLNVGRQFLEDAVRNHFVTLEESLQDARHLMVPVMMLSAGKDAWVAEEDLQAFQQALGSRLQKKLIMPDSLHRLQENPKLARQIYRCVTGYCRETYGRRQSQTTVLEPNRLVLARQHRIEKHKVQIPDQISDMGAGFWKEYLQHFQSVGNCEDYLMLLDHVFHALGPVSPGQRILDVGCGNGTAGWYLYRDFSQYSRSMTKPDPVHYVGIDVIGEALQRARRTIDLVSSEERAVDSSNSFPSLRTSWAQMDLQMSLPFSDACFDRIFSNLVLGYLNKPDATLEELYRVLAPGGRMVISNLKPDGDFSGIYQRLVTHAQDPQERVQARELLNNYGKIRQAEKEGRFHFYDRNQWREALNSLGQQEAEIYPTFANQAYLIVIRKPFDLGETILSHRKNSSLFECEKTSTSRLRAVA